MVQIGTAGRLGAAQPVAPVRRAHEADGRQRADAATPVRALVALDGGRSDAPRSAGRPYRGGPVAGFVAQLIVADDPSLRPSRLERTRAAAALYAETARRLA